jgi:hypothetical protein
MLDEIRLKFQYYDDNNGVQVGKPWVSVTKTLGKHTSLGGHFTVDGISGASRVSTYPALSVDAVTAASRSEARKEFGVAAAHKRADTRISLSAAVSEENDYRSRSGSLDMRQDLFQRNATLNLQYTMFDDEYNPVEGRASFEYVNGGYLTAAPGFGGGGQKDVHSALLGWTQTLGRRTMGMASLGATLSRGYLSRPYYLVLVEDTVPSPQDPDARGGMLYLESHPDSRDAYTGLILLRQHYPSLILDGSVNLEYRRYWDSWGITSNTFSVMVSQYLHSSVFVQLGYRNYSQTPADFYRHRYTQRHINPDSPAFQSYMTVDPRLSSMDSHLFQAKLAFMIKNFFKPSTGGLPALFPVRFDVEAERYLRSTHSDPDIRRRRYEFYGEEGLEAWIMRAGLVFYY